MSNYDDGLKQHFAYVYCTDQFVPKTEDSFSNNKLKHFFDSKLIL